MSLAGGGYLGLSWGSQDPEVTQLCVIQRARVREGILPWTGRETGVVAIKGLKPRQSLAIPEEA